MLSLKKYELMSRELYWNVVTENFLKYVKKIFAH